MVLLKIYVKLQLDITTILPLKMKYDETWSLSTKSNFALDS